MAASWASAARLVPDSSLGRAGATRTTFVEGAPDGDAALVLIDSNQARFCPDVRTEPPPGWDPAAARGYRTFLSVPVIAGGSGFGMLSVDAPDPGDLTAEDESLLRLMAGPLADGLAR
jgi:GAF domain-containing protein